MKKLYVALFAMLATASAASAKVVNLKTTMYAPTMNQTVVFNQSFPFKVEFKNLGPDAIAATDSLFYTFTGTSSVYYRTGLTKAVNDTIYLNTTLTFTSGSNGNLNFCAIGQIFNGTTVTDSDTSNNRACTTIKLTGSTGIGDVSFEEGGVATSILKMYPNPSTNMVNLAYVAANESELTAHVYDMSGREVLSHSFGKTYTGKEGFTLDISALNKGLYFVEMRQDGVKCVGKMTKE